MRNCRTCKYADWRVMASGRRSFYSYAECKAPIEIVLPACVIDIKKTLEKPHAVACYDNKPVECDLYEKITKDKK